TRHTRSPARSPPGSPLTRYPARSASTPTTTTGTPPSATPGGCGTCTTRSPEAPGEAVRPAQHEDVRRLLPHLRKALLPHPPRGEARLSERAPRKPAPVPVPGEPRDLAHRPQPGVADA